MLSLSGTDAGSFSLVGNTLHFNGGANFEVKTSYSVTVKVDDASVGGTPDASQSFTLTISDVNEAPTVANAIPDQTADSGVAFSFQFSAAAFSDVDAGDSLTYTAKKADGSPLPTWLNFNGGARTFAGTPAEADVTNFDFFVIATDSGTTPLSVSDTVHLTVRDKTAPIVSLSVPAKTNDNTPSITVSATDGASGIAGQTVTIDVDLDHSNTFGDAVGELGYTTGTMSAGAPFTTTFDLAPSLSDGTYGVRARIDDAAGNSGTSGTQTLVIDTIAPTATITTLQTSPTKVTSISYKVTFNEAVSNITTDDFGLTLIPVTGGSVTANIASVSASSVSAGGNVTVVVNGIAGNGSLMLTLNPGSDITDGAGNVVSTASSSAIALDQTKPTADIVNVTPDPRSGPIDSITVKFSESVIGLDLGDFTLERTTISFSGSTTTTVSLATATLSGSGSTYSIGLLTGLTAVEGTYLLTLKSSETGIVDAAGNEQDTGATDDWLVLSTQIGPTTGGAPNKTLPIVDIGGVGGNSNDNIVIKIDPTNSNNLLIIVEGKTVIQPLTGISNLQIDAGNGDDTLTLDFSNGALPVNITFNGGVGGHDTLVINNGAAYGLVNTTYTGVNDGALSFTSGGVTRTVNFTGLEPITITGTPPEMIFNLPNGNDGDVMLKAVGSLLRLSGSTFELTDFDPTGVTSITINLGGGNDKLTVGDLGSYTGKLTINGGDGNDRINASASKIPVSLTGGAGNDLLTGSAFDDTLQGGNGKDTLQGGNGIDRGDEFITGAQIILTNSGIALLGKDTLTSIERFQITGDSRNNLIDASAFTLGPVALNGGDGNDTLIGTSGNDTLDGGNGFDTIRQSSAQNQAVSNNSASGAGDDSLTSIESASLTNSSSTGCLLDATQFVGSATLNGGSGNDTLKAGSNSSSLSGGAGNDAIVGGNGFDTLDGGAGNDTIDGGEGNDVIKGGEGNDLLKGNLGDDRLFGENGNDRIFGGNGQDLIDGGAGNDTMLGEAGHDSIYGGAGNDALRGGEGDDLLSGDAGNDTIIGDAGTDTIRSNGGSDKIIAGAGNDRIEASGAVISTGDGDDTVIGTSNTINEAYSFNFDLLLT